MLAQSGANVLASFYTNGILKNDWLMLVAGASAAKRYTDLCLFLIISSKVS